MRSVTRRHDRLRAEASSAPTLARALAIGVLLWAAAATAQTPPPAPTPAEAQDPGPAGRGMNRPSSASAGAGGGAQDPGPRTQDPGPGGGRVARDPYEAYAAGLYDQALQGFLDVQVERPEDPEVLINLGNSHYQMRDWAAAESAFATAAAAADPGVRQQALYSLGNCAYRQGRLTEAVAYYQAALDLDPDDEDSKFNLEFVRDEIRRRHEEAQKQQQQGRQQPQQQGGDEPQQGGDEQQQQGGEEQQPEGQPQGGGSEEPPSAGEQGEDQDRDGLPDEVERSGDNPTDPANPDTDGDGLLDGQEDANASGRVDPSETDPNRADSDGDGTSDGEEAAAAGAAGAQGQPGGEERGLTPEEAERYLQALEEGHPRLPRAPAGDRPRPAKDW